MTPDNPDYKTPILTSAQTAKMLNKTVAALFLLVEKKRLTKFSNGNNVRFNRTEVEELAKTYLN